MQHLLGVFGIGLLLGTGDSDWPQFRGPESTGKYGFFNGPAEAGQKELEKGTIDSRNAYGELTSGEVC